MRRGSGGMVSTLPAVGHPVHREESSGSMTKTFRGPAARERSFPFARVTVRLNGLYGWKFPIGLSPGIIVGLIALSVAASLMFPRSGAEGAGRGRGRLTLQALFVRL